MFRTNLMNIETQKMPLSERNPVFAPDQVHEKITKLFLVMDAWEGIIDGFV